MCNRCSKRNKVNFIQFYIGMLSARNNDGGANESWECQSFLLGLTKTDWLNPLLALMNINGWSMAYSAVSNECLKDFADNLTLIQFLSLILTEKARVRFDIWIILDNPNKWFRAILIYSTFRDFVFCQLFPKYENKIVYEWLWRIRKYFRVMIV